MEALLIALACLSMVVPAIAETEIVFYPGAPTCPTIGGLPTDGANVMVGMVNTTPDLVFMGLEIYTTGAAGGEIVAGLDSSTIHYITVENTYLWSTGGYVISYQVNTFGHGTLPVSQDTIPLINIHVRHPV